MLAFAVLTYAFVTQDFSVAYVAQNSNLALPWYYRFPRSGARMKVRCCCGS